MLARPLGYVLAFLVALTSGYLTLGLSRIARAQEAGGQQAWAVLDFNNNTGYGGAEVGRQAADALDVELYKQKKYDVVKRSEVADSMNRLGLQFPLDIVDVQRLGHDLDVRAVVSGDVLSITRNDRHQVQVVVAVRVTDVASGDLINGALAQGSSSPRAGGGDEDEYVNEAIRKAAFAAVNRMQKFNLPIATILNYQGPDQVLLNKGSRDGFYSGLNMMVLRNGQETGRLKVASVDQDSCIAGIVDRGTGMQPQDRAHALFTMPSYSLHNGQVVTTEDIASGPANYSKKKSSFSGVGGIILAVLAAAFLIYLVNRGASQANVGGSTIGTVIAQASNNFGQTSVITAPTNYGVRLNWKNGSINPVSIVEWNVYRDTESPVGGTSVGGGASSTSGTNGTSIFANGPCLVAPRGTYSAIDDGEIRTVYFAYSYTGSVGGSSSGGGGGGSSSSTSGGNGISIGQLGHGYNANCPGATVNQVHNYEVTAVYSVQDLTVGTLGYEETPLSVGAARGYATPLYAVDPTATTTTINVASGSGTAKGAYGATGANLSHVILSWASAGIDADDYVVDFATNAAFTNKYTVQPNGNVYAATLATAGLNLGSQFGLNSNSTTIFYRIGCRHMADNPGPYLDSQHQPNADVNPNGGSYLYAATTGYFSGTYTASSTKTNTGKSGTGTVIVGSPIVGKSSGGTPILVSPVVGKSGTGKSTTGTPVIGTPIFGKSKSR